MVAGEVTTSTYVDIPSLVRETVCDIGYDNDSYGFNGKTCGVLVSLDAQSPDIAQGVDAAFELRSGKGGEDVLNAQGAGDQGMMFGYACDETPATSCHCPSGWPTASPSAWPRCATPPPCRTCGPTARPRSRSSTRVGARCVSTPS